MPDQQPNRPYRTYLFTVRLWAAQLGSGLIEYRGKVQHVLTGEAYYFRGWPQLVHQFEATIEQKEIEKMTTSVTTNAVHHVTLTVSDVRRSQAFYSELLGFNFVTDFGPRAILQNGSILLALTPPPDPDRALVDDRFNENRIGLDHLSLNVSSLADLEAAVALFDAHDVSHGEIKPLDPFGIAVLAFRDPDNIQMELTAPLG